jgi:hypothetical protein
MSITATVSTAAAAASRLLGRQALGWTAAAALGAGSGYYAGSGGLESGHTIAVRPAATLQGAPRPTALDLVPATLDQPALVEPQPPAS